MDGLALERGAEEDGICRRVVSLMVSLTANANDLMPPIRGRGRREDLFRVFLVDSASMRVVRGRVMSTDPG